MKTISLILLFIFGAISAKGQQNLPEVVTLKIREAFIPTGFDNNDRVEITVEGVLPTTCYKVGPHNYQFDPSKKELKITQYAYKYKGLCMMMPVRFQNTLNIGLAQAGDFVVRDGVDGASLGRLPVAMAMTADADDYLYAPVSDVQLNVRERSVTISGSFSHSCVQLKEVKISRESHNVVTVLPLSESIVGHECKPGIYPFSRTVALPFLNDSRYLLHVRSLDGQATNKLFSIGEPYL